MKMLFIAYVLLWELFRSFIPVVKPIPVSEGTVFHSNCPLSQLAVNDSVRTGRIPINEDAFSSCGVPASQCNSLINVQSVELSSLLQCQLDFIRKIHNKNSSSPFSYFV